MQCNFLLHSLLSLSLCNLINRAQKNLIRSNLINFFLSLFFLSLAAQFKSSSRRVLCVWVCASPLIITLFFISLSFHFHRARVCQTSKVWWTKQQQQQQQEEKKKAIDAFLLARMSKKTHIKKLPLDRFFAQKKCKLLKTRREKALKIAFSSFFFLLAIQLNSMRAIDLHTRAKNSSLSLCFFFNQNSP